MIAFGIVRGTRWGYKVHKKRPDDSNPILKSRTLVKLLLRKPKVATRVICDALDEKKVPLPWSELRKRGELWSTCATQPRVKMAISHARLAAKQLVSDERWIALINSGTEGDLFEKFQLKKKRKPKQQTTH